MNLLSFILESGQNRKCPLEIWCYLCFKILNLRNGLIVQWHRRILGYLAMLFYMAWIRIDKGLVGQWTMTTILLNIWMWYGCAFQHATLNDNKFYIKSTKIMRKKKKRLWNISIACFEQLESKVLYGLVFFYFNFLFFGSQMILNLFII